MHLKLSERTRRHFQRNAPGHKLTPEFPYRLMTARRDLYIKDVVIGTKYYETRLDWGKKQDAQEP